MVQWKEREWKYGGTKMQKYIYELYGRQKMLLGEFFKKEIIDKSLAAPGGTKLNHN